jgi:hypothetical protein
VWSVHKSQKESKAAVLYVQGLQPASMEINLIFSILIFLIIILEINPVKYFFFKSGRFEWRQSGATYEGVVLI